jgi:hypothetical protein
LHRLGELSLLCAEAKTESEPHFHTAINVARKQDAKSLELRATISLGGR